MIVDLYAGAGGWDLAARQLGRDPVGIEWDVAACATRAVAGLTTIRADIDTWPLRQMDGRVDGLIASPPCQAWSIGGKRLGADDPRGHHVWQPLRWAETLRPDWVCLEQVPPVLPIWRQTAARLRAAGYSVWCGLLDAADYGVPQNRRRAVLIASQTRVAHPPEPTHSRHGTPAGMLTAGTRPWVTMGDALGWADDVEHIHGRTLTTDNNNVYDHIERRPAPTITNSAGRSSWKLHTNRNQRPDGTRQTVSADEPAPTVALGHDMPGWCWARPATTVVGTFGGQQHIAPPGHHTTGTYTPEAAAVPVTVEELAVLQDFPADHPWQGNRSQIGTQIGNAVPVGLARAILAQVLG